VAALESKIRQVLTVRRLQAQKSISLRLSVPQVRLVPVLVLYHWDQLRPADQIARLEQLAKVMYGPDGPRRKLLWDPKLRTEAREADVITPQDAEAFKMANPQLFGE
jgi:hypothetical protein